MPIIEVSIAIRSPKDRVYSALKDMESFPNFMRDVKNLKITKRINPSKIITIWETEIEGAPVTWKEEDNFDDSNYLVRFNMLEGNYKGYQGQWSIQDDRNGARLILRADFDWGLPFLEKYVGKVLEEKARRGLLGMLQALKNKLEKNNV
jgi:ribosome-associated toxin RatA of RatAB toxin-antitoxin module